MGVLFELLLCGIVDGVLELWCFTLCCTRRSFGVVIMEATQEIGATSAEAEIRYLVQKSSSTKNYRRQYTRYARPKQRGSTRIKCFNDELGNVIFGHPKHDIEAWAEIGKFDWGGRTVCCIVNESSG